MTTAAATTIVERVRLLFPRVEPRTSDNGQPFLLVPREELTALATYLRDQSDLRFGSLVDLTGYDLLKFPSSPPSDAIAVVLLLHSLEHRHALELQVHLPRTDCSLDSVSAVWPAAIYFEREVFDLLGVHFTGHPGLKRILLPDDWIGHPLRKDYLYPSTYDGVAHAREGQRFEGGPRFDGPAAATPQDENAR